MLIRVIQIKQHTLNVTVLSMLISVKSIVLIILLINFTLGWWHDSELTSELHIILKFLNALLVSSNLSSYSY
jgi:hypothetical protein